MSLSCFDYPTAVDWAANQPNNCCSSGSWQLYFHSLLAFTVDLLGCLPIDKAYDRTITFALLCLGLVLFVDDPGWSNQFSKFWLVTFSGGYGASCMKSWKDRASTREKVERQRAERQQQQQRVVGDAHANAANAPVLLMQPGGGAEQELEAGQDRQQRSEEEQGLLAEEKSEPSEKLLLQPIDEGNEAESEDEEREEEKGEIAVHVAEGKSDEVMLERVQPAPVHAETASDIIARFSDAIIDNSKPFIPWRRDQPACKECGHGPTFVRKLGVKVLGVGKNHDQHSCGCRLVRNLKKATHCGCVWTLDDNFR